MKPIVTLTLNPAIDGASEADIVRPTRKVRTTNERYEPGGGGINVARVIQELGGDTFAVYLAGGRTGLILDDLVKDHDLAAHRIDISGNTRISHNVFERSTGLEYRFIPEGPEIGTSEWQPCLERLQELEWGCLVASGSVPRGVPTDFYVRVADIARGKKARFILDTSGPALRETVTAGGIHLVKPSLGEFEYLVGRKLSKETEQHDAAMSFIRSGKVDLMAVTLGRDGAFLAGPTGVVRLPAVAVDTRSAVGAGDSFLGAMTLGLAQGLPALEAFMLGIAAGAAAVLTPGIELCKRQDVKRLFTQLQIRHRQLLVDST